jgi:hypothetical protein
LKTLTQTDALDTKLADTAVMDHTQVVIPPSKKGLSKIFDFDFMQIPLFNKAVKSRLFQPVLIIINLAVFVVLIMAGLIGTPVGNKNAAIMMIWIFWFFLLTGHCSEIQANVSQFRVEVAEEAGQHLAPESRVSRRCHAQPHYTNPALGNFIHAHLHDRPRCHNEFYLQEAKQAG